MGEEEAGGRLAARVDVCLVDVLGNVQGAEVWISSQPVVLERASPRLQLWLSQKTRGLCMVSSLVLELQMR